MDRFLQQIMHCTDSFGLQTWLFLLAGVIVVGAICMRGFGSRSQY